MISRRSFAITLAAAPALLAQQPPPASAPAGQASEPPGRHPVVPEKAPFEEPLSFVRRPIAPRVNPFPLTQVRLLAGPCLQASEWNRAYLDRLPVDRLVHNFRTNAGLSSSANPFGGWEAPKVELRGHFTGHYLSAAALRFAAFGDREMKNRGDEMVGELAKCQAKLDGGYLSAFPPEFFDRLDARKGVWAPFYTIHKIMAGLFDMYSLAGNRQALDVVTRMAEWADRWTASKSYAHMQDILRTEFGGMSEVLYNLAAVTAEDRWATAGDRFNKSAFLTPLAQRRDELRSLHANTHIPQIIGAARRYELTGDPRFRDAAQFFFDTVTTARTYVTGGSSNTELWLVDPGHLAAEMASHANHQECCCAYNMMKLTRHLYQWNPDPRYFDYYERNLYNHRLGAIQPSTGLTTYFVSLAPGSWRTLCTEDRSFWCCTGTALEEYSKLASSIYHHDASGIYVNLFLASELDWTEQGIKLRQQTSLPDEPRTSIAITATRGTPWSLRLRIPSWTDSPSVRLNGKPLEASATPGSYFTLTRTWKTGDRVDLELPMRLRSESLPDAPNLQAFLHGPIVLAGELGNEGLTEALMSNSQGPKVANAPKLDVPTFVAKGSDPGTWIKPTGKGPLSYRTQGQTRDVTLSPLNSIWQRYAVYWNVS